MKVIKKLLKWLLVLLILLVTAEIILHFYNPFRTSSEPVVLQPSKTYTFTNDDWRLDAKVTHSKNAKGFRGSMPNDSATGIVVLGGGAVECRFLNDGKDWPTLLGSKLNKTKTTYWLQNAGVSGLNSEGCLTLLKQSILQEKPKYLIVMMGIDDIALRAEDIVSDKKSLLDRLILPGLFRNVADKARRKPIPNNAHYLHLPSKDTLALPADTILERLKEEEESLHIFKQHLDDLIQACRSAGIQPVFISQPMLYGDDTDPITNTYLGNLKVGYHVNGKAYALMLKQYNRILFETAEAADCPFINLSARIPKDSRYYYDGVNFSNDGSEMVAEIIFNELSSIISER